MASTDKRLEKEARQYAAAFDDPVTRRTAYRWLGIGATELVLGIAGQAAHSLSGVATLAGIFGVLTLVLTTRGVVILMRNPWRKEGFQTGASFWANGGTVVRFNDEPGRCFVLNGLHFESPSALEHAGRVLVAGTGRVRVVASMDRSWMRSVGRPRLRWAERRIWRSITRA